MNVKVEAALNSVLSGRSKLSETTYLVALFKALFAGGRGLKIPASLNFLPHDLFLTASQITHQKCMPYHWYSTRPV